ncbi:MAG TPA: WecB/TagA/CpsF family glycosyltransferase, partial [Candidatus Dormibacteraeota bacterium]|nr:WecB/TagA/CpsF family glycosyltransferase [Candidatus Dormibacteraeota bacterium]
MSRVELFGIPIDQLTQAQAVDWVAEALSQKQPRLLVSINPERMMQALRDPALAEVLRGADLNLADGAGVLWAARRLGRPLPGRVSGVDFLSALAARGAAHGWRFFFLGGDPGVAEAAGAALRTAYPGFDLVGSFGGSPDPLDDPASLSAVRACCAQLVFVAYGGGGEDAWLSRNLASSGAVFGMGVGGAFDFISGR